MVDAFTVCFARMFGAAAGISADAYIIIVYLIWGRQFISF